MSISLSCPGKVKLLDKAAETTKELFIEQIKENPRIKITGDNLDMYIRTNHQRQDNSNKDIHWFASNAVSCRLDYTNIPSEKPNVRGFIACGICSFYCMMFIFEIKLCVFVYFSFYTKKKIGIRVSHWWLRL